MVSRHLPAARLAALVLVTAVRGAWSQAAAPPPATVIVVRHAEKAGPTGDVPLSEAGAARARLLAEMLAEAAISAIYATPFHRTRDTARPLAERLGLPIDSAPHDPRDLKAAAAAFAGLVRARHAGQTVLVIGHSNTVPLILEAFTGMPAAPMADDAYDDLYVVTAWENRATATHLKYGKKGVGRRE